MQAVGDEFTHAGTMKISKSLRERRAASEGRRNRKPTLEIPTKEYTTSV